MPGQDPACDHMHGQSRGMHAQVRATLDQAGGHEVRVVPCIGPMLHASVDEALQAPEPTWSERRPDAWGQPGAFSTHRAVLFSGMS